ncbi:MAG TPA: PDR/VanB family oxidoreductase [Pseudonocardiaceae bacterium]|jgi:ferredoxin-NADP reductase
MTFGEAAGTAMSTVFAERRSDLVVTAREEPAEGVIALTLADPKGAPLPAWTPGAHIDLLLGDNNGDNLVRQYSLCGSLADQRTWRIGVLLNQNGRGGSRRVHETLRVGREVAVRGPRNHFPLHRAPRYVFIAGGIGITPMLPMITVATGAGADWRLWYGGRSRATMAFLDDLQPHGDRVVVWPEDEQGLVPLAEILGKPQADTLVYCCGPEALLAATEGWCAGWQPGSLHLERFAPKPQILVAPAGEAVFDVVCQRSGITVQVPPGKTIIDVLDENGVSVLSSCLEGVCGTCETRVIDGTPEHRDSLLTEEEREENEYMMICVSRALSQRLVLDL